MKYQLRTLQINKKTAFIGVLLLAFSGTSVIWSGFISLAKIDGFAVETDFISCVT